MKKNKTCCDFLVKISTKESEYKRKRRDKFALELLKSVWSNYSRDSRLDKDPKEIIEYLDQFLKELDKNE